MRVAIYRCLYGTDFVEESIQSVLPHVDQAVVCLASRPWGTSKGVSYKGEWVAWPAKFDDLRERVEGMREPSVAIVDDDFSTPVRQHEHIVRDIVLVKYPATEIVVMEPDWVFRADEAACAFAEWDVGAMAYAATRQVELWKTPAWRVLERAGRSTPTFLRVGKKFWWPTTFPVELNAICHNLGFCYSDETMKWKHLTAMAFSEEIGDTPPDPAWLDRWRNWRPEDRDLEVALGCSTNIPWAVPYDVRELPESIRRRYKL